jgi:CheY-like chemotaxis protein
MMVNLRSQSDSPTAAGRPRLHVLLTEDRPHGGEHWISQLPRLLQPQGVVTHVARSAQQAITMAGEQELHAAVIDLATPIDPDRHQSITADGGRWLVQLLNRMPSRPPVVIITHPAGERQSQRILQEALQLGAFTVLSRPVEIEHLLGVFRRMLDRHYAGAWPRRSDSETSN